MNNDEYIWSQKYRPKKVLDCVLPKQTKDTFQAFVDSKNIPNLLLYGPSGTGKTTVAIAMCNELGLDYILINSSDERGIDVLRDKVKNYASSISFSGNKKVIILDESDFLTGESQAALRGMMEEFTQNVSFILTCNFRAKIIDAIHSRCQSIDFKFNKDDTPKLKTNIFKRLKHILDVEKVEYNQDVLVKLINKYFPDFRKTINQLQQLCVSYGKLDENSLASFKDIEGLSDLMSHLKSKDFTSMRKWVGENSDIDYAVLFRRLYDNMYTYIKSENIPQLVLILAKYQYQSAFVMDQEINTVAALTEILIECEFK